MSAPRRRWVVVAIVAVLLLATIRLLDQPLTLESYRLVEPATLEVVGHGARNAWTHVTDVTETDTTVTVAVSAFTFQPFPGTASAYELLVPVPLKTPLGTRDVIDGSTGQPVVQAD